MLSVSAFQKWRNVEQQPDAAVKKLRSRGYEMCTAPDDELQERRAALGRGVKEGTAARFPLEQAENLHRILSRHVSAFRRALHGDAPTKVKPMMVQLKRRAKTVKARHRRYDPTESMWLA